MDIFYCGEVGRPNARRRLEIRDNFGDTALAGAAVHGKFRMAECMVSKNMKLLTIGNSDGDLPVTSAISVGQIKMARYLYSLTPPEYLMPERGDNGGKRCPRLAFTRAYSGGPSPISALASMPHAFPSANRHVFWKRWIYSGIHIESSDHTKNETRLNINSRAEKCQSDKEELLDQFWATSFFAVVMVALDKKLRSIPMIEKRIAHLYEEKLIHVQSQQLLLRICEEIANLTVEERENGGVYDALSAATENGIFEIFFEMLRINPDLLWTHGDKREVESVVHPKVKEARNKDGLTPRQVFSKDHEDMMKNGEKWMKDTSTSCTVVGALILTIMFAAAFTVPGGNNQTTGLPIFLNDKYFRLFIIADALSLFSSSTSVLMFLGILTSRYAEVDFLESLPKKMIIGLSTLFFSIAAMMIAFYAALSLMLDGLSSITFPVICLAGIPVTLFVLLQFPLLVEMVVSTYGPGIFNKKIKPLF
ncbi:hypothetical protein CJ030_MR1G015694 [Morella rubra]|uniref:PGG domain-containing protein n=1 Tax=Morella rubra TaxID=262757 RepID=A0A6A1WLI1_9ROSI|nr:hypothetical protein CJ030_MR1G015694 [Morella rubra]